MTSKMSGFIKNRTYTCRPSALGRCDHVTALLHLLNNFISEKGYIVHSLSTSKSCTRNKGKRRLNNHKEVNNDSTHTFKEQKRKKSVFFLNLYKLSSWTVLGPFKHFYSFFAQYKAVHFCPSQFRGVNNSLMNRFVEFINICSKK